MPMDSSTDRPVDMLSANYPLDCWWFAARSEEIGAAPIGGWYLDRPVVMYRKGDGAVVALDDRCPHRWAPLSLGRVDGDSIRCAYHGFAFGPDGNCVEVPSLPRPPRVCRVDPFEVVERDGVVWLWLGDRELARETPLPVDTGWLVDPASTVITGTVVIDANYQLLKENVLDLTHLPHVHGDSLGLKDWTNPPRVTVEDRVVTYRQAFPAAPLPPQVAFPTGIDPGHPAARANVGRSISPAAHHSEMVVTDPDPAPGRRSEFKLSIFHFVTPESPRRFRYTYFFGWDVKLPPPAREKMAAGVAATFAEDKAILEAVQNMVERDPRGLRYPEVIVKADHAAIEARRKLHAMLIEEARRRSSAQGAGSPPTAGALA